MNLSQDDIKLIVRLVSEKLGPNAGIEEIKNLVSEVIDRLPGTSSTVATISNQTKKLIINAFGPNAYGLENKIRSFVEGKPIYISDMTSTVIDNFRSVIAVIDYSNSGGDINQLKFDISKICETSGFKAIIQDSGYYGL